MDKVEKIEETVKAVANQLRLLEDEYPTGRLRGQMYNHRIKSIKSKMDYHIDKLKKLGNFPVAIVDVVLVSKISNSLGQLTRNRKRITLVDLTRDEIDKLLKIRYQDRLVTYKVQFLVTGIKED